jgi:hypothetical protein
MKTAGGRTFGTSALGIFPRNTKRKLHETSINRQSANHSNPPKRFKPNNHLHVNNSVSRSVPKAAVQGVRNADPRKEVERIDQELERMEQE